MKDTDRLFEAAFDGSELDVRNLRQGLSKTAAEELDSLVSLKADLKKLGDVPECQLTTDHLRRAVLNSRPRAPGRRPLNIWTWTPLVAAASLGLLMFVKGGSPNSVGSVVSKVVNDGGNVAVTTTEVSPQPIDTGAQDPVFEPGDIVAADTVESSPEPRKKRVFRSSWTDNGDVVVAAANRVARDANKLMAADFPAASTSSPVSTKDEAIEKEGLVGGTEKEPVVIVSDHANPMTGAAEAQEVSRPSDVVFGG